MALTSWLPYTHVSASPQARLFCFAHSGGAASIFRNWRNFLPNTIEVCSVQLPGRENRFHEPLITSMDALVTEMWHALSPLCNTPLIFFGHSLGALIAYELVKKVHAQNNGVPLMLMVSACCSPSFASNTLLHTLTDDELIENLIAYGGMSAKLLENKEALKILLPRLRADITLFETYKYSSYGSLDCPITACGGSDDHLVAQEYLKEWQTHTKHSFSTHIFPGGHFYYQMHSQQLCQLIINHLYPKQLKITATLS